MTTHRARHIVLLVACSILADQVEAQAVAVGDRVRIVDSYNKNSLMQGTLVRVAGDSVVVAADSAGANAAERAWLVGGQHSLQRSAGMKNSLGRGLGVGLLVGLIAAAATHEGCTESWDVCQLQEEDTGSPGPVLILGGILAGGVVGLLLKHERWEKVAGHPIKVGISPTAGRGMGLRAAVSF